MTKFQFFIYRVFLRFTRFFSIPDPVTVQRLLLSREMKSRYGNRVLHGRFAGMKLPKYMAWGEPDRSSMLLGAYEAEVLEALFSVPERYDHFVDLGAADGYYAIGTVLSGRFTSAVCYEMSAQRRLVLSHNAAVNGVEDRIEIHGSADSSFVHDLSGETLARSLVLIDVEGAEFDLLTQSVLRHLSNSVVIVELHDHLVTNGESALKKLVSRAESIFHVDFLAAGARDSSNYDELSGFSDNDRWLVFSEGRKRAGRWMRLIPMAAAES